MSNNNNVKSEVPYRPLGLIKEFLEKYGFSVTHCYEDLVFIEHNAFLLQMGERGEQVFLVFNVDCDSDARDSIARTLTVEGLEIGLLITVQGTYRLIPNTENETLDIEFHSK